MSNSCPNEIYGLIQGLATYFDKNATSSKEMARMIIQLSKLSSECRSSLIKSQLYKDAQKVIIDYNIEKYRELLHEMKQEIDSIQKGVQYGIRYEEYPQYADFEEQFGSIESIIKSIETQSNLPEDILHHIKESFIPIERAYSKLGKEIYVCKGDLSNVEDEINLFRENVVQVDKDICAFKLLLAKEEMIFPRKG